jgi:hypothetical protein
MRLDTLKNTIPVSFLAGGMIGEYFGSHPHIRLVRVSRFVTMPNAAVWAAGVGVAVAFVASHSRVGYTEKIEQ